MMRFTFRLTLLAISVCLAIGCGREEAPPDSAPTDTAQRPPVSQAAEPPQSAERFQDDPASQPDIPSDQPSTTQPSDAASSPQGTVRPFTDAEYEAVAKINPQLADLARSNPSIAEALRKPNVVISPPFNRAPDYTEAQRQIDRDTYFEMWNGFFDTPRGKTLMAYIDQREITGLWPPSNKLENPITRDVAAGLQSAQLQQTDLRGVIVSYLFLADCFVQQDDPIKVRLGLELAHYLAVQNATRTKDHDLGLIIADLYLVPHLKHAWPGRSGYASRHLILSTIHATYLHHEKYDELIKVWKWVRDHPVDRVEADTARHKLAQIYELNSEYNKAIPELRAIDPTGPLTGVRDRIKILEEKTEK